MAYVSSKIRRQRRATREACRRVFILASVILSLAFLTVAGAAAIAAFAVAAASAIL